MKLLNALLCLALIVVNTLPTLAQAAPLPAAQPVITTSYPPFLQPSDETKAEETGFFARRSTVIGMSLIACSSLLALVGAVALRRRLDKIAPDP